MLNRMLDRLWGRGEYAVTIPPMDGALRPNTRLDDAPVLLEMPNIDDIACFDGTFVLAAGANLVNLDGTVLRQFDKRILALAALAQGGLAIALENGEVTLIGGSCEGQTLTLPDGLTCITAMVDTEDGALYVSIGAEGKTVTDWRRDLLEKGCTGALWRVPLDGSSPKKLAGGLAWAGGVACQDGRILVSESWRARILAVPVNGDEYTPFIEHLPAYPGRLEMTSGGAVWACFFAPRRQLLEFVLREDGYRKAMLSEVHEDHWIAPSLRSGQSFLQPLQQGGVKQLGVLKPWAPSFSYGLVVRIDAQGRPTESLHSRADGTRHGVTACIADGDALVFVACGDGVCGRCDLGEHS